MNAFGFFGQPKEEAEMADFRDDEVDEVKTSVEVSAGILAVFNAGTLAAYSDGILDAVEKVAAEARARVAGADVSTAEGREVIRSTAYKVARSKHALDDLGAELVVEQKRTAAAVDASRREMRGKLDAVKDEIRKPLTEFEEAEALRVNGHENALSLIEMLLDWSGEVPTANAIRQRLETLRTTPTRDWQEFKARAQETMMRAERELLNKHADTSKAEHEAAELAREERARAAREQRERDERIAAEAAGRAKREAEHRAEIAARQERSIAEAREAQERRRAELAEQAAADAVKREQERAAAAKAAEDAATAKREANKRHRAKINREAVDGLLVRVMVGNPVLTLDQAKAVVVAIARGEIPHVTISY